MKLNKTSLSFDQISQDLLNRFDSSIPWSGRQTSNLGTVLVDMISGTTETSLDAIHFAAREPFLNKAVRPSSVFAHMRSSGIRLSRRTCAKTRANITNPTIVEVFIPAYDTFSIGNSKYYTRENITLLGGESKDIDLLEGIPYIEQLDLSTLDGEYPKILLNSPGFVVADNDVRLFVSDGITLEEWYRTDLSLFSLNESDKVFYDQTTETGDVELSFGTGSNGTKLPTTGSAILRYVKTSGSKGNGSIKESKVSWDKDRRISGKTTEDSKGGADIKPVSYYKNHGAVMKTTSESIVTLPQWNAAIKGYPGVGDVVIQTQRDIAPNDPTWRNLIRVCVLPEKASSWGGTNPNPTSAQWDSFIEWLSKKIGKHLTVQKWNPTKVPTDVNLVVYVYEGTDLTEKKSQLTQRINKIFEHKGNTLGRQLALDDLSDACKFVGTERDSQIDYITIMQPTENITLDSVLKFVTLRNLNILVKYTERSR